MSRLIVVRPATEEVAGLATDDDQRHLGRARLAHELHRPPDDVGVEGTGQASIGRDDDDLPTRALALLHQRMAGVGAAHEVAEQLGHLGGVRPGVPLAGEPREGRREVERRVDAVEVHVAHAGVDVVRAGAHLVEADRLEAALLHRATDDRVETHLVVALAVVEPVLHPRLVGFDARCRVDEALRDAPFEHVRRLHEVVVDRDEGEVAVSPLRFGQERHRLRARRHEEIRPALQLVEPGRHTA